MKPKTLRLLTALAIFGFAFTLSTPGLAKATPPLEQAYLNYRAALKTGKWKQIKPHINTSRAKEIEAAGPDTPKQFIEFSTMMSPPLKKLRFLKEKISGDKGTLNVKQNRPGLLITGTLQFAKEGGSWKLVTEDWHEKDVP